MGNAFSTVIVIAAIVSVITGMLSCYASYAVKLNWWPFKTESPQKTRLPRLHEVDHKLLLEMWVVLLDIKAALRRNQEPTANM